MKNATVPTIPTGMRTTLRALVLIAFLAVRAVPEEEIDVRGFLPGGTLAYVELTSLQDTWRRLKALSLEGLTDEERSRREKLIDDARKALVDIARDRAGISIGPLLGEINAFRWALLSLESANGRLRPHMIFEIETKTPGFLESRLREIAGDRFRGETEIEGFRVYEVWVGMTDPRVDSLYAAVLGKAAVLSTRKEALSTVLAGVRAGGVKPSLLENPHFQAAQAKAEERPVLLGFADAQGIVGAWLGQMDRAQRMDWDQYETWFGYRSLTTVSLVGRIEKDLASFALSAGIGPGADLYQTIRQEPAEMDSLRLFPPGALNVDVLLLHEPANLWKRLSAFLKERLSILDPDVGEETFDRAVMDVEDIIGATLPEVLGVLDEEVAFGLLKTPGEETSERDMVLAFQVKDRAEAERLIEKVRKGELAKDYLVDGDLKSETYAGETLWYTKPEDSLSYVILDRYIVLALDLARLRRVVDTYKSEEHVGTSAPFLDARKAVTWPASKLVYANLSGLFALLLTRFFDETPEEFKSGTAEGGIVVVTVEREGELAIEAGMGLKGASAAAATVLGYAVPKVIEAHQEEIRERCMARMEVLGARARDWADKHDGEFASTVEEMGLDAELLACEADGRAPPAGSDHVVSYRYVPVAPKSGPTTILFFEEEGIHAGGRMIVTVSGEAEFELEEVFRPRIRQQLRQAMELLDKWIARAQERLAEASEEESPAIEAEKAAHEARKAALAAILDEFR